MGISRLDAWAIQSNEVYVEAYRHKTEEKYGMAIYLMKNGEIDRLSISTNGFPYGSEQQAKTEGTNLVNEIRKMNLGNPGRILEEIVGEETAKVVKEIVDASRK
jgi:hypothetical protein